jgi:hypothetical protein
VNAYGGAANGTVLKLVNNCPANNTDCTWTYHQGMWLSDTNPGLAVNAYGGAANGTVLKLVNNCPPNNTDCMWTYHKGMWLSDTNQGLAVNAYGGAANGTVLRLVNNCNSNNTDCTWTYTDNPPAIVPDVSDLYYSVAEQDIKNAGLQASAYSCCYVRTQSPLGGTLVKPGSTVVIDLGPLQ